MPNWNVRGLRLGAVTNEESKRLAQNIRMIRLMREIEENWMEYTILDPSVDARLAMIRQMREIEENGVEYTILDPGLDPLH